MMNVKINSTLPAVNNAPATGPARGPTPPAQASGAAAGERVDLSSLSARLQETGAGEAPIHAARVAEIRQAIGEGRFQINPERIADGLLADVRTMLDAKR